MIHVIYEADHGYDNDISVTLKVYEGPDAETFDLVAEWWEKKRDAKLDEPRNPKGPDDKSSRAYYEWMCSTGLVDTKAAWDARAAKVRAFEDEWGVTWLDYLIKHRGFKPMPFKEYEQ